AHIRLLTARRIGSWHGWEIGIPAVTIIRGSQLGRTAATRLAKEIIGLNKRVIGVIRVVRRADEMQPRFSHRGKPSNALVSLVLHFPAGRRDLTVARETQCLTRSVFT